MSSKDFNIAQILSGRSRAELKPANTSKNYMPGQVTLDEWMIWKEDIRNRLQESKENFVVIGYRLKQIRDTEAYRQEGYGSVTEFAQAEYGLTPTYTSRFMKINDKYSVGGNSMELEEEYRGYSYSVLCEMLTLDDVQMEQVVPGMTVREIREIKQEERQQEEVLELDDEEPEENRESMAENRMCEDIGRQQETKETTEPFATSQMEEEWKEPKKEPKPIELPPADAVYTLRISRRQKEEILRGLRFLILKKKNPYRVGNTLVLEEYVNSEATGESITVEITYLEDESGGIEPGWCVIQIGEK